MRRVLGLLGAASALAGCATGGGWARMEREFAQVRANCMLLGTDIERDRRDRRLIHLIFRHRNNMVMQAREEGRVACAQLWAEEQGWRLTTEPDHGTAD